MGLFKLAAIVAVGVSLLPAEREKQEQLYLRAASAANWTLTFCERNSETCVKGSALWSEFSKKAEFGAKLAYDVMRDKDKPDADSTASAAPASLEGRPGQSGSTLTPHDLRPAWRGKTASKSGI